MEKVYFYNSRKQKLVGVLHKQGKKGIIVSHGFSSNKENVSIYTKFLQSKGYPTLAFDYSGHGESEGDITNTTATAWKDDLNAAIDFMKQHCDGIALLGFSLGGMSSLLCSSRSNATIAIAPPTNFRKLVTHFIKTGLVKKLKEFIDFGGLNIKHSFITDSAKYDMKNIMKKIKCPILLIHGDEDDIVPLSQSQEIIEYINEPKKLVIIEGMTHNVTSADQMTIIYKEISEWLEKYLYSETRK
jgi:esterase/lipase